MISPFDTPEENLVAGILQQATDDLWESPNSENNSLAYFISTSTTYGSFLWCCDILGLDVPLYLKRIATRMSYCLKTKSRLPRLRRTKQIKTHKLLDMFNKPKGEQT